MSFCCIFLQNEISINYQIFFKQINIYLVIYSEKWIKNLMSFWIHGRRNPTPYTLLIIPRLLPSEIMDEEHFVTDDLLNLTAGSGSSSKVPDTETSSWELVSRTLLDHPLPPVGVPILLKVRLAGAKRVTARQGFRYPKKGLVLPLGY